MCYKHATNLLLARHADVNWKDGEGRRALSWATERNCDYMVRLLLEAGVEVGLAYDKG